MTRADRSLGAGLRILRACRAHEHRTAAGLLAVLVFAYLWPVLVGGKALVPSSFLYDVVPWRASATPEGAGAINPQLSEAVLLYYPWHALARQLLHAGTFPAWNPYALAGTPLFGNFQVAWLSPFSLPLWLLPLNYGIGLAAALKLWLAGFGTYLLARELRLGFWPGMLAAVSFTLCAFNVVWLAHGVFVSVAAMLPWGIWLAERLVRRGRAGDGLALAGVVAVAQTGGHAGTQLHVLAAIALYALVRTAASEGERRERLRRLGLAAAALGVGTMLAAVVLLPAHETAADTIGVAVREHGSTAFPGARMPFHVLRTGLFPEWWGRPSEVPLPNAPANFRERTFFAGSTALALALVALVSAGGWRRKAPFVALAVLGAAIAVRGPLHALVVHLPLFDTVQDQRILLWFLFAVALLAGFGLQSAIERPRQRRAWAVLAAALLAAIPALLSIDLEGAALGDSVRHFLDRGSATSVEALRLASVGWWIVPLIALAGTLLLVRRRPRAVALVALLAALEMLHFAHGYQLMSPVSTVVPPRTPAIAFLQRHAHDGRVVGLGNALPDDIGTLYGLRDIRGRDVPQPTSRFNKLWVRMDPRGDVSIITGLSRDGPKVLGLLGARYLVGLPGGGVAFPGLRTVYEGSDATVYANAFALPRALVASRARVAADLRSEIDAVMSRSFDARRDAVVRRDELAGIAPPSAGATGTARVMDEENAAVTLRATLRRRGLVVLDDAWAPGWKVTIDGRPARALQADVVLRGVVAPAGTHTIRWSYRVPGLRMGAVLSVVGLLIVLACGAWIVRDARMRPAR